jgi:hypothetical protein
MTFKPNVKFEYGPEVKLLATGALRRLLCVGGEDQWALHSAVLEQIVKQFGQYHSPRHTGLQNGAHSKIPWIITANRCLVPVITANKLELLRVLWKC